MGAWELELSSHLFGPQTSDFWPSRDTSAPTRAETREPRRERTETRAETRALCGLTTATAGCRAATSHQRSIDPKCPTHQPTPLSSKGPARVAARRWRAAASPPTAERSTAACRCTSPNQVSTTSCRACATRACARSRDATRAQRIARAIRNAAPGSAMWRPTFAACACNTRPANYFCEPPGDFKTAIALSRLPPHNHRVRCFRSCAQLRLLLGMELLQATLLNPSRRSYACCRCKIGCTCSYRC